jgi:serine/threonine protein phosphatase PrpC
VRSHDYKLHVKGRLQPSRAIGDAYLKHSEFNSPSPTDVLATFFSEEQRNSGDAAAKAKQVLANAKIKQLTESSGFALSGESFYPAQTVGSASIGYGNVDADLQPIKPNSEAAMAAAGQWAKRYGRHIPPGATFPYITSTPETTIIKLGASGAPVSAAAVSSLASQQQGQKRENMHPDIDFSFSALPSSLASHAGVQRFIVLGCDGLWDVMSNQEVVHFIANDSGDKTTVASRLVQYTLLKEAEKAGLTLKELMSLPPGRKRRGLHDDITVVVLFLGDDQGSSGQLDGATKKKGWLW